MVEVPLLCDGNARFSGGYSLVLMLGTTLDLTDDIIIDDRR